MNDSIRVGIVDDHPLFREGIIQTIRKSDKFVVVGEGASLRDAQRILETKQPDMVLLDIGIPGNAMDTVRTTIRDRPKVKVVILTALDDEDHVTRAIHAGANGYVLKGVSGLELLRIMESVYGGERYVSPDLAWRLLVEPRNKPQPVTDIPSVRPSLSPRERQVLDHSCQGLTNLEIAKSLGVSVRTVKYYKTLLFGKM